jgi:hypothetical protein
MFLSVASGRSQILCQHLPGGLPSMFLSVDGGHSWIFSSSTSQGGRHRRFSNVDGERSRIFSSGTSQGARHRRFLKLMVAAPEYPALKPPKGPVVDIS